MATNPIKLIHCFTHLKALGGVQTVLDLHLKMDGQFNLDSRVLAYFEDFNEERASGLGLKGRHTPKHFRHRFGCAIHQYAPEVGVYLNFWGLPLIADLDVPIQRRIGVLHSDWPGLDNWLQAQTGLTDGIITISDSLRGRVLNRMPSLDPDRVLHLPCPITPPVRFHNHPRPQIQIRTKEIHIGMVGRVGKEQKRVDRIPDFIRCMDLLKQPFRLDILGDGPQLNWVKELARIDPRIHALGRLTGDAYWSRLGDWDAILFLSDFEGIPLALLEAMSLGVLPVYPDIGGGGKPYVESVFNQLIYPKGDSAGAADALSKIARLPPESRESLAQSARLAVQPHLGSNYINGFAGFIHLIREMERISIRPSHSRPFFLTDYIPFGILKRCMPSGIRKH